MGDRMGSSPIDRTNRKDDNAIVFFSFYASFFIIFGVYLKYLYAAEVPYRNGEKVRFMALSAKVFALTVLVGFHGFFDCDFVVAQRTFQNIHRIFVVLLDGENLFSGIIFIRGGLKFDIRADGYRERRIATDEVCPIFPVGIVVFCGFYRVQKFVRDGVRNILVVYDIFVYRNRVFKTACAFRVAFFAVTES